ncbi:MAG: hypothetical protein DYG98_20075 [Haliscomenobacteraceae bacterium CHB4]|nr:hypothetical protein [Haliscomenobacteraceae bacterium CHB4]
MNEMVEWRKNATITGVCFFSVHFYCNVFESCHANDKLPQTGYLPFYQPLPENIYPEGMIF